MEDGWIGQGVQATHQFRAGHLPASSLINHISTSSLRARFPARPTVVDINLPPCLLVSHSPVCSNSPPSASCLSGRAPLSLPYPIYSIRARTRADIHCASISPVSRAATALRHRSPPHRHDERLQRYNTITPRGARLLAPPHFTMAESSSADAGKTRSTHVRLVWSTRSCDTRNASVADATAAKLGPANISFSLQVPRI